MDDSNDTAGAPLTCADIDRDAAGEAPSTQGNDITLSGTSRVDGRWVLDKGQNVTIEPGTVFIMGTEAEVLWGWRSDPASIFADGQSIEFAEFRYGGKTGGGALIVNGGSGTISNSSFSNSAGAGVLVKTDNDKLTISDNTYTDNAEGDLVGPE